MAAGLILDETLIRSFMFWKKYLSGQLNGRNIYQVITLWKKNCQVGQVIVG